MKIDKEWREELKQRIAAIIVNYGCDYADMIRVSATETAEKILEEIEKWQTR